MAKGDVGRPSVINAVTVQKLEKALRDGFTIERACQLSGVSRSTFYTHATSNPDFSDKMELAQSWATERAKANNFEPYMIGLLHIMNKMWDTTTYAKETAPIIAEIDEYEGSNQMKGKICA